MIFRRSELTHPLVQPERGGTLDALRELVNLPEEDYRLAIAWVVAAYLTGIPHPILLIQGEQGTAKSNLIRTLLALVDPQPAADRTPPKDQREWAIFARASWAFCFDNITDIPAWLSNALCKGVTGDAVLQRVLHSDDDIGVYSFQRVIALTTIAIRHDLAGDLADRILLVEPEVIEMRRTEAEIAAARAAALPAALGAVLDLVPGCCANCPARPWTTRRAWPTSPRSSPRSTRYRLGHPGQLPGQGRHPGAVPDRGQHLRLRHLPARHQPQPRRARPGPWEGTAAELLDKLRRICAEARMPASDLPEDVRAVGRQVREIAPSLRKAGVDIRPRKSGPRRLLRITKIEPTPAKNPGPLFLRKKKRHVPHVPSAHRRRSEHPKSGTSPCGADVPHVPPRRAAHVPHVPHGT